MIDTTIEKVKYRKNFFRNIYRKELVLLIISIITQVILIAMIVYVSTHRTIPAFYGSSSDGILTQLTPMPTPNQSDKPLLQ